MDFLSRHIRDHSRPLAPIPAGESPRLAKLEGIRAAIFDIYGTMLISAAGGDAGPADETEFEPAIRAAIEFAGFELAPEAAGLSESFHELIRKAQASRREAAGIEFPEVEIREIWRDLLAELAESGLLGGDCGNSERIERVAVAFECAANPVWPMPGLADTLRILRERELQLGIVSNAQFYTPLMFPALLDRDLEGLGFAGDLRVYSFQQREGKPSRRLYEILAGNLAAAGIRPEEALYVGNDRLKDVLPARAVGFRTALFAGDRRSLRWRRSDPRVEGVSPDLVITELNQIADCLVQA